jgi:Leucine-rich repeat (LRR) protein
LQQVVAALLQRASRLRSLAIHSEAGDATLGAVPACLASYHGLTSLALSGQGLQELPTGEYLSGLQSLDLRHNEFARMPAALSYATALTTLALDGNKQLALDEANVWVLLDLRLLRQLSTHGINIAAANQYMLRLLRWRLPHLRLLPLPAEAAAN